MTFALNRSGLGITGGGVFTIGEVDLGLSAVLFQARIPILAELLRWTALTDGIFVNGKKHSGHGLLSEVGDDLGLSESLKQKTLSLLDSGTSLSILPFGYWDAVYCDIPGLEVFDKEAGYNSLPYDTKLNVSVIFNGTEYPINPLDLMQLTTVGNYSDDTNQTICLNAFVPQNVTNQGLDIILGNAFMRNAYALFNFGSWTTPDEGPPYVQLLSTTNQGEAWAQCDEANYARIQQ